MDDATPEDFQIVARHSALFVPGLPDRIITHLQLLAGDTAKVLAALTTPSD